LAISHIKIIGAGLAGSEAALQLAKWGIRVSLYEMRPQQMTPAHKTDLPAELVCSNSLKSTLITTASGLLKAEMRLLDCELLKLAESCLVPAGSALAVDRDLFAREVLNKLDQNPKIDLIRKEVIKLDDSPTIIASGPLTSPGLTQNLINLLGEKQLCFFDAIAPIISSESIDYDIVFSATRYEQGDPDYLNCPFDKKQYLNFIKSLKDAEKHQVQEFENQFFQQLDFNFYQNCTPIEELLRRGDETLRYGVMRPVGLYYPNSDKKPYAIIQLRAENINKTAYNLVGCQTMLKYGEQKRIFRMIPGLEKAEFLRYGSVHRNTYLNSPEILNRDLSLKKKPNIYIAGQLAGVEGYVESILSGLLVARVIVDKLDLLPETSMSGQLWRYLITPRKNFQPMNANFGILPVLNTKLRDKKKKKQLLAERSLKDIRIMLN